MKDKFQDRIDAEDARVLAELSVGKKAVFEFGTFAGGSAMAMLPQIKEAGGHLWCIDHFRDDVDVAEHRRILPHEVVGYLLERVESYLPHMTIIVGDIQQVSQYPAGMADMVFVDASHHYSAVKRDIQLAQHLCKPGGTICGHDYVQHYEDCNPEHMELFSDVGNGFYANICYGVIRAVHEAYGRPNHDAGIWWVEHQA